MKTLSKLLVLSIFTVFGWQATTSRAQADVVVIDPNSYAAVSYSPSTGKYGYAWNHNSRFAAERAALAECTEKDAKIVGWVRNGFLALAIGDDNAYGYGFEYGDGARSRDAVDTALSNLAEQTTGNKNPKVLIVLCSGNVQPQVIKK